MFHRDDLGPVFKQITKDSIISIGELSLIRQKITTFEDQSVSITDSLLRVNRRDRLKIFIDDLKKYDLEVVANDTVSHLAKFNWYTSNLPEILQDSILTAEEKDLITKVKNDILEADFSLSRMSLPKFWFKDTLSVIGDYNRMIACLDSLGIKTYHTMVNDTIMLEELSQSALVDIKVKHSNSLKQEVLGDELIITNSTEKPIRFHAYYYTMIGDSKSLESYVLAKNSSEISLINPSLNDSTMWSISQLNEFKRFNDIANAKRKMFQDEGWITRNSELVRRKYLNSEVLKERSASAKKWMEDQAKSFK